MCLQCCLERPPVATPGDAVPEERSHHGLPSEPVGHALILGRIGGGCPSNTARARVPRTATRANASGADMVSGETPTSSREPALVHQRSPRPSDGALSHRWKRQKAAKNLSERRATRHWLWRTGLARDREPRSVERPRVGRTPPAGIIKSRLKLGDLRVQLHVALEQNPGVLAASLGQERPAYLVEDCRMECLDPVLAHDRSALLHGGPNTLLAQRLPQHASEAIEPVR